MIVTQTPGYAVRLEDGQLDLALRARYQRARCTSLPRRNDSGRRSRSGGVPLAELDGPFATAERGRLEEQRLAALELPGSSRALGRHAELVPELEVLVREQPLRERLRLQRCWPCGCRQADALEVYRSGRRLLDEELEARAGR